MLEQLHKCAMEVCGNDETLLGHFYDGFLKSAGAPDFYQSWLNSGAALGAGAGAVSGGSKLVGNFQKGLMEAFGKGAAGLGIGLGVHGISTAARSINDASLHTKFLSALEKAMSSNVVLKDADKQKVAQYAETVFKFAPHVATDSNLLSSILANAIHGEGIDPMTIKTLGDLEARYLENRSGNLFSPKAYV